MSRSIGQERRRIALAGPICVDHAWPIDIQTFLSLGTGLAERWVVGCLDVADPNWFDSAHGREGVLSMERRAARVGSGPTGGDHLTDLGARRTRHAVDWKRSRALGTGGRIRSGFRARSVRANRGGGAETNQTGRAGQAPGLPGCGYPLGFGRRDRAIDRRAKQHLDSPGDVIRPASGSRERWRGTVRGISPVL